MTFELNEKQARIVAVTSGKRREGILHQLIINGEIIPIVEGES